MSKIGSTGGGGASGGVTVAQLNAAVALDRTNTSKVFEGVADQAAMLALAAVPNNKAVRPDGTWQLEGADPTNAAHWKQICFPSDGGVSVFSSAATYEAGDLVFSDGGIFEAVAGGAPSATTPMDALGTAANQWKWRSGLVTVDAVPAVSADGPTNIRNTADGKDYYVVGGVYVEESGGAVTGGGGGVNSPATGAPAITGTLEVGQTLTADTSAIADSDGLGAFSYQWKSGGTDIAGATGATYVPVAGDAGQDLTVTVSFTDGAGNDEAVTSPVATVSAFKTFSYTVNGLTNGSNIIGLLNGGTYDIDWGDGTVDTGLASNLTQTHTYATPYSGDVTFKFDATNDITTIRGINQEITSVGLTRLPKLTSAMLPNNNFSTIDVTQCPDLTSLQVYLSPGLTAIDTSNNPLLVTLSFYSCSVTSFDTSNNPLLSTFSANNNGYTGTIDLSANVNLTNVNVSSNANLTALTLPVSTTLSSVNFAITGLATVDVSNVPNITTLNGYICSSLSTVGLSNNPLLDHIWLYNGALPSAVVDQIIIDVNAAGVTNGDLRLQGGTNGAPTATSAAALANLTGTLGWTVTTN